MPRDRETRVRNAAAAVLTDREQVDVQGGCWAVQRRSKVPLLFLGRHRYHLALTDRRVLIFARRRGGPDRDDLVLGKRYGAYEIEKVRRGLPMFQVRVRAGNGARLVFEFPLNQRTIGRTLVERLEGDASVPTDTHIPPMAALLETPIDAPETVTPPVMAPPEPTAAESGLAESGLAESGRTGPAPDAGLEARGDEQEPSRKDKKRARNERKGLDREAEAQREEPPDAGAQEQEAARFWDPPA